MMGYVYFIGNHVHGLVKIGYTAKHPRSRLKALQTGCPVQLSILGFVEGDQRLEAKLHLTFAPLQLQGEWFRMDGKLTGFVLYFDSDECADIPAPPQRLEDALHDNVLCDVPPHPAIDPKEYLASANASLWAYLLNESSNDS